MVEATENDSCYTVEPTASVHSCDLNPVLFNQSNDPIGRILLFFLQFLSSSETSSSCSYFFSYSHRAEMKDEETSITAAQKEGFCGGLFGRGRYKIWVLGAIVLLALWSMFTTSVTLKWSAVNLKQSSDDALDSTIHGDIDVLDLDEREKMVKHMWDVYSHSMSIRLQSFWREAFEAAYQDLTSEAASIRDAAISEIAKMSFRSRDVYESPPVQSTVRYRTSDNRVKPRRLLGKTRRH